MENYHNTDHEHRKRHIIKKTDAHDFIKTLIILFRIVFRQVFVERSRQAKVQQTEIPRKNTDDAPDAVAIITDAQCDVRGQVEPNPHRPDMTERVKERISNYFTGKTLSVRPIMCIQRFAYCLATSHGFRYPPEPHRPQSSPQAL